MDCIVPTNHRPQRLGCMLATLLTQQFEGERRLILVDNSGGGVAEDHGVRKMLRAFRGSGWQVEHRPSHARSVTEIKVEALGYGSDPYLALIDNDILFTRGDTLQSLKNILDLYDVAIASPTAFDLDEDRPICVNCEPHYDRQVPDENGVVESVVSFGTCMVMRRVEVEPVLRSWRWRLPYLEDQVLAHFLKRNLGYANLRTHSVLHWGETETPTYMFHFDDVIGHIRELLAEDPQWQLFLELQLADKDGVDFPKNVERRCAMSS